MSKVRVTLINNGNIVDGYIAKIDEPEAPIKSVLVVEGIPYTAMEALMKGMYVFPVRDPIFEQWQNTFR